MRMNWALIVLIIMFTYSLILSIIERIKYNAGTSKVMSITLSYLILAWLIYQALLF